MSCFRHRKRRGGSIYEWPDDVLCINVIAINEMRADNDARVARYIGNQCNKRSQSHGEMRCIHAARELIQSFCGPLLKFPLENALARIEPSAGYQPSKWQSELLAVQLKQGSSTNSLPR